MSTKKYYAVIKGRNTGIFTSWNECEAQVKGFKGAIYKSYKTRAEAQAALGISSENINNSNTYILESICVDASCLGNPGDVEYRGVSTKEKAEIFHSKIIPYGTNNLGEFLTIVHGLAYLKKHDSSAPIYSDSQTAILWVKNKKVKTQLPRNPKTAEIFALVDRAIAWLENNTYSNQLLKWDTQTWGEIPADFGRK
jgi:ribonuclease HI